ncbi:Histone H2B.3 like [Actinidia chinensis var. chinensis]|uniref:Histone H2B.3 like n=1 Tax=Actinidia chinensis var. chinensis TaxID=1590841 RepID=A0A2R6P4X6_ACTCC|nr:Histone H2B.3 like [Actinidia chinensis var. chinensis]
MDKSKKSQILKLSLIALLLILTPLIPTSLKPIYLYFLFNLLIISLGAEAGLLSFFSKPPEDKKPQNPNVVEGTVTATAAATPNKPKAVEKCSSEKIVGAAKAHKVRKSPSTPSIFFIGGGEREERAVVEDGDDDGNEEEEEVGGLSGQDQLFIKAETFIGNFYKQLKMQREDSWKRIHGFYQNSILNK